MLNLIGKPAIIGLHLINKLSEDSANHIFIKTKHHHWKVTDFRSKL